MVTPYVSASSRHATPAGIGLMVAGIAILSIHDAFGKWLVADYPVGELLFIRNVAALILISPFIWQAGLTAYRTAPRRGLQVVRLMLASLEIVCFIWSVRYLPLADVLTFYMAGPIYVTGFAAFLLGEHVDWRRWSAVMAGFVGVLLALRHSAASATWPALVALAGSVLYALLFTVTRALRATPNIVLSSGQVVSTLLLGAITAPLGWTMPTPGDFALMAWLGALAIGGIACVNHSLKLAPASVVAPYQYTMIIWGVVLGRVMFGDTPGPNLLVGAAIVVAAGLFILWRERLEGAAPPSLPILSDSET